MKPLVNKFIQPVSQALIKFVNMEAFSGILLLITTVIALVMANMSATAEWYSSFVNTPVSASVAGNTLNKSLLLLVNDGLMAIFFFLVGMEIKREILIGELSSLKKASFSIFAAVGGMVLPALIFFGMNRGTDAVAGWAIPMATDIAFALGILTLLGKRVPVALKVFLLALAIVDDLGAILVIALFYTDKIALGFIGGAFALLALQLVMRQLGVRNLVFGLITGVLVWFCFLKSGVHATIAGVLLALLTPAFAADETSDAGANLADRECLLDGYIHDMHPWVAYFIMPVFAFFNAGVSVQGIDFAEVLGSSLVLGIVAGLVVGKSIGVFAFTWLGVKFKLADLPEGVTWPQVFCVGLLAGIGFTMSLFISSLAFKGSDLAAFSKLGILLGSSVAMAFGLLGLIFTTKPEGESSSR